MCGICGFTHLNSGPDPEKIWNVTRAITHRGPDQQGVWESQSVSLGAVRLKIIDLEHGAQPMKSGDVVLVFNGEIYNHAELRRELEGRGHHFDSRCDTEVVLRAFLEWDTASFGKLRGMFAAALWRNSDRRLVLVRDRLGIKPLYYARRRGDIYFGSELKCILLHPEIPRHINLEGLDHYLSLNYVPSPHTLVEGIDKLAPGHFLEWVDGNVRTQTYWNLKFAPDPRISLSQAKEELDQLLRDAVREHLISDVPLGVWSSGGLDSSTILHYASEAAGAKLKTFSVSFRGRKFDESPYFRQIAERYQTDHHEFDLNPEHDLASTIEELAYYSDEPSADAGALPVWFLSKMCRQQVTVALSGEGADELFGGYNTYRADAYARRMQLAPRPLRRLGAAIAQMLPASDEKIGFDYKVRRMFEGSLLDPVAAHFYWNGTFSPQEKRDLYHPGIAPAPRTLPAPEAEGVLNRFLALDQRYYLADDILYKCDRMSMAHSLEVRPPFLDHRIVEFAARLPEPLKIRGSQLKVVLRELMRDKLPPAITGRPKEGFDIPTHHWLRTTLRPLLSDTLTRQAVEQSGLFRWSAIERVMRDHQERRANLGYHLWGLLVLFLWMKRWNVTIPTQTSAAMS